MFIPCLHICRFISASYYFSRFRKQTINHRAEERGPCLVVLCSIAVTVAMKVLKRRSFFQTCKSTTSENDDRSTSAQLKRGRFERAGPPPPQPALAAISLFDISFMAPPFPPSPTPHGVMAAMTLRAGPHTIDWRGLLPHVGMGGEGYRYPPPEGQSPNPPSCRTLY